MKNSSQATGNNSDAHWDDVLKQMCYLDKLQGWGANPKRELLSKRLPFYISKWVVVPRWQTIAPQYTEAVQKVLDLIVQNRANGFVNLFEGYIYPGQLREDMTTIKGIESIGKKQRKSDMLLFPVQLNGRHKGRSPSQVYRSLSRNEFPLCAFTIAVIILTHPEIFQSEHGLGFNCSGTNYRTPEPKSLFEHVLGFWRDDERLCFGTRSTSVASPYFTTPTGFVLD